MEKKYKPIIPAGMAEDEFKAIDRMANKYRIHGDFDEALELYTKIGNIQMVARCMQHRDGNTPEVEQKYRDAMKDLEKKGDYVGAARVASGIGDFVKKMEYSLTLNTAPSSASWYASAASIIRDEFGDHETANRLISELLDEFKTEALRLEKEGDYWTGSCICNEAIYPAECFNLEDEIADLRLMSARMYRMYKSIKAPKVYIASDNLAIHEDAISEGYDME